MTYILGLNAYHADAAACLVKDGDLVAAVEEERFRRIKHWGGFPSESIRYCLKEAGISLADVGHVAVNSDNAANRWRKLAYVLTSGVSPSYIIKRLRHRGDRADVAGNLQRTLPDEKFTGTVHAVEHHLCHLASAFLVSPFDKAVECAKRRGYEIAHLVARRVAPADFDRFDAILAMDKANLASLRTIAPTRCKNKIELLLDYGDEHYGKEVPDPYGRPDKAFEIALDMIEDGCRGLAAFVTRRHAVR